MVYVTVVASCLVAGLLGRSMKRVIRNHAGLYFKGDGTWTLNFEDAKGFAHTGELIEAQHRFKLSNVDLVLIVHDAPSPQWDVVLPLSGH